MPSSASLPSCLPLEAMEKKGEKKRRNADEREREDSSWPFGGVPSQLKLHSDLPGIRNSLMSSDTVRGSPQMDGSEIPEKESESEEIRDGSPGSG